MPNTGPQTTRQTEDGAWGPAQPLGYQGAGLDFEVTGNRPWHWTAYQRHRVVAAGKARTRLGLIIALRLAKRRHAAEEQTGGGNG